MRTRIDHTTIVSCRGSGTEIQKDGSILFEGGKIKAVGPTSELSVDKPAAAGVTPPLADLVGRPLGAILVRSGRLSREQLNRALEQQAKKHNVIGQTLLEMELVSEAEIEWALAVQAGRQPDIASADTVVIDGSSYVVTPGLVNAHHHLFQSLTRCLSEVQTAPLFEWLTGLYERWGQMDEAALRLAATASLAELALCGCTTTSDQHYLFPSGRGIRIDTVLETAEAVGLRIHAGRGCMTLGETAGGLQPDDCCESEEVVLADSRRVIDTYHDDRPHAMRRIDLTPCSPFNVSPTLFDAVQQLARERGLLLHTHAAETLDEERFCLDRFGLRPIAYLERHGWLGRDVSLAHCVQVNEAEIDLLARTETAVVHCPSSNMRLGSGIAPIRRMLDAGVRVGLGVDGSSSNDGGNVLAEARQALLLQRVGGNAEGLRAGEAFRMVTAGGADVLHRPELGRIEPGAAADLVLFDRRDPAFAGALAQDAVAALVLAQPPRPVHVFVAGRPIVQYGRLTRLDWRQIEADFDRLVCERFGRRAVAGAGTPSQSR
jgi:cytosine/adenosine deaminase-related metal-dependent hydrolase